MFKVVLDLDPKVFDTVTADLKVSSKENNGIQLDENGALKLVSAQIEPGNARNVPGNSIAGNPDTSIDTIRLNKNVTRKIDGDPTEGNEGPQVASFISGLIGYLLMKTTYVETVTEYTLLTAKPDDWDDPAYMQYFIKNDKGEYVNVETKVDDNDPSVIIIINFQTDTYYKKELVNYGYQLLMVQPNDWETNYKDYYVKDDANNFTNVIGNIVESAEEAPEWKKDTYYIKQRLS